MSANTYQAMNQLRPVSAFVSSRKEMYPPITALTHEFRLRPPEDSDVRKPAFHGKPKKHGSGVSQYLVPRYMATAVGCSRDQVKSHTTSYQSKPASRGSSSSGIRTTPSRSILTSSRGQLTSCASTSVIQHNKEIIYNLSSVQGAAVKDVHWQRDLRKSPYSRHDLGWKRRDEQLRLKTVSTGNLRLFLQEGGGGVTEGKALVKVCYNYCRSCSQRMSPIRINVNP